MNLPERCERCFGGDWVYASNGGVERCNCARGRALNRRDINRGRRRTDVPGISTEQATLAVKQLAVRMRFMPRDDFSQADIVNQLRSFVCCAEELYALVEQATLRFGEWPGVRELRALYCAMFDPKDGAIIESAVFEGEIPLEPQPRLQIEERRGGGLLRIGASSGYAAVAPAYEKAACELCGDKGWVTTGERYAACVCDFGHKLPPNYLDVMNGLHPPTPPPMPVKRITQADVDRIKKEQRQKQGSES